MLRCRIITGYPKSTLTEQHPRVATPGGSLSQRCLGLHQLDVSGCGRIRPSVHVVIHPCRAGGGATEGSHGVKRLLRESVEGEPALCKIRNSKGLRLNMANKNLQFRTPKTVA